MRRQTHAHTHKSQHTYGSKFVPSILLKKFTKNKNIIRKMLIIVLLPLKSTLNHFFMSLGRVLNVNAESESEYKKKSNQEIITI